MLGLAVLGTERVVGRRRMPECMTEPEKKGKLSNLTPVPETKRNKAERKTYLPKTMYSLKIEIVEHKTFLMKLFIGNSVSVSQKNVKNRSQLPLICHIRPKYANGFNCLRRLE